MPPATSVDTAVRSLRVSAYTVPTDAPESDGTIEWDSTTIVLVEVAAAGKTGLGYSYAHSASAHLIESKLRELVEGKDALDIPSIALALRVSVRNIGAPGIASTAISAIDNALWDLKGLLLDLPLASLLGRVREGVPVYGSGGFTSYSIERLQRQLHDWVSEGVGAVKMKVGREPAHDLDRVRAAREAIGSSPLLMVDANGAYSRKQALEMARGFAELGVCWFEEPVSSDDLAGLRLIRDNAPAGMEIAAGEYGYTVHYFNRMLEAGAVDVLQADATRCGGISGFLAAATIAGAHMIPLSSHTAPAIHASPSCAPAAMRHIEYFHDHVCIERTFFEGGPVLKNGVLYPRLDEPGLGLRFKARDAGPYLVFTSERGSLC